MNRAVALVSVLALTAALGASAQSRAVRIDGWQAQVRTDAACAFDVDVNFYGNLWARCATRDVSRDELIR